MLFNRRNYRIGAAAMVFMIIIMAAIASASSSGNDPPNVKKAPSNTTNISSSNKTTTDVKVAEIEIMTITNDRNFNNSSDIEANNTINESNLDEKTKGDDLKILDGQKPSKDFTDKKTSILNLDGSTNDKITDGNAEKPAGVGENVQRSTTNIQRGQGKNETESSKTDFKKSPTSNATLNNGNIPKGINNNLTQISSGDIHKEDATTKNGTGGSLPNETSVSEAVNPDIPTPPLVCPKEYFSDKITLKSFNMRTKEGFQSNFQIEDKIALFSSAQNLEVKEFYFNCMYESKGRNCGITVTPASENKFEFKILEPSSEDIESWTVLYNQSYSMIHNLVASSNYTELIKPSGVQIFENEICFERKDMDLNVKGCFMVGPDNPNNRGSNADFGDVEENTVVFQKNNSKIAQHLFQRLVTLRKDDFRLTYFPHFSGMWNLGAGGSYIMNSLKQIDKECKAYVNMDKTVSFRVTTREINFLMITDIIDGFEIASHLHNNSVRIAVVSPNKRSGSWNELEVLGLVTYYPAS